MFLPVHTDVIASFTMLQLRKFKICNIVAHGQLNQSVNLEKTATVMLEKGINLEYDNLIFPGMVCRMKNPKSVILLFNHGKLICMGAKKLSDVRMATRKFLRELESIDINFH
jgi:transcription initiation factor TFIID TATA-box-binding protein